MNRIYTIPIDDKLDLRLKEFQKQLNEGEEIIGQVQAGNKLVITTKEDKKGKAKNLLLEEIDAGKMPNVFGSMK